MAQGEDSTSCCPVRLPQPPQQGVPGGGGPQTAHGTYTLVLLQGPGPQPPWREA